MRIERAGFYVWFKKREGHVEREKYLKDKIQEEFRKASVQMDQTGLWQSCERMVNTWVAGNVLSTWLI